MLRARPSSTKLTFSLEGSKCGARYARPCFGNTFNLPWVVSLTCDTTERRLSYASAEGARMSPAHWSERTVFVSVVLSVSEFFVALATDFSLDKLQIDLVRNEPVLASPA